MVDIFAHTLSTPTLNQRLCHVSEPHPRGKALPFLHGSEALGNLTWPAHVITHIHSGLSLFPSSLPSIFLRCSGSVFTLSAVAVNRNTQHTRQT